MDECKSCGKDIDRQGTHWEGCHTSHPECAAFNAGREAGMREASEKLRDQEWIDRVLEASPDEMTCEEAYSFAILSAIGGDK